MKRKNFGPFFLLSILITTFWCCQDVPETPDQSDPASLDLETIIPGTWEAVSMAVQVNSAEGQADSTAVFRINDGDWDKLFNVLPPRTYFEKDHKYRIEFRDRRDSIMDITRGMWNVFGDTLMMIEPDQSYQYLVRYGKGQILFSGFRDWDQDGAEDDNYTEIKRRVSIGTE